MQTKETARPDGRGRGAFASSDAILQCSGSEGHALAANAAPLDPRRSRATLAHKLATLTRRRWFVLLTHDEPQPIEKPTGQACR